jgi:hypothetical protein
LAQEARRPTAAINIMNTFGGVRSALCRAKLIRRDPLSKIPAKAARHNNMPMIRTVVQSIGVGRLQNNGSSSDRPTSTMDELLNDMLNDSLLFFCDLFYMYVDILITRKR